MKYNILLSFKCIFLTHFIKYSLRCVVSRLRRCLSHRSETHEYKIVNNNAFNFNII